MGRAVTHLTSSQLRHVHTLQPHFLLCGIMIKVRLRPAELAPDLLYKAFEDTVN